MDLLACNWQASTIGEQVCRDLRSDPSGDQAVETLKACFGTKSPNTLLKRASALRRYYKWHSARCVEVGIFVDPIPLEEHDVWAYFQFLRAERHTAGRGFTSPGAFLETIRFCKFTVGLRGVDDILTSGRLLGFAALERREKGPIRQAPPLEVEHLRKLHEILASEADLTDRLGAGVFLICIYARARWSDIRYVHHVDIEARRNGCLVLYTTEHKTSEVGLRREQFLPLVVPLDGIVHNDWISSFLGLYETAGLDIRRVPLGPLLPAPKAGGGFGARPLSTSEASVWLRLLLKGTSNAENCRSHSLKTTLLSWCARSGMDKEVRAVLGHHCSSLTGSNVVYARELQTRPIRKLQMLLKKNIRLGLSLEDMAEQGTLIGATPGLFQGRTGVVTPAIPAASEPVERGTMPEEPIPIASSGALDQALEVMNLEAECESVKDELDLEHQSKACAAEVSLFPLELVQQGLIAIDSSSGSDSSEYSESSEEEPEARSRKPDSFSELVPPGFNFWRHAKSGLVHCAKVVAEKTKCGQKITENFTSLDRIIRVRHPKCLNCFPKDPNRIRKVEDLVGHLDAAIKRARG